MEAANRGPLGAVRHTLEGALVRHTLEGALVRHTLEGALVPSGACAEQCLIARLSAALGFTTVG